MKDQEIYEIPLYIEPERTVAEVHEMLNKLFGSELLVSRCEDYDFSDGGMTFSVQYYENDHDKLMKLIDDCGIKVDEEAIWEMMD